MDLGVKYLEQGFQIIYNLIYNFLLLLSASVLRNVSIHMT